MCDFPLQDRSIVKADGKISVEFSLGRRLLSPCMTIYVPTLLLNIIALATNYFKVIVFVFVLLNIIALASNYLKVINFYSFHLSRARSSLFDINATFDISLFRRVIKQNFQMCRYISQDFFFEAVVTVNLTALLVLSTMFIGSKIVLINKNIF